MSFCFATKGQSAAVAAQQTSSGQQYQLALGQHPAGQEVSLGPHCFLAAIFMSFCLATKGQSAAVPVGIGAASSRAGSLIRSTLLLGSHLHELLLLGNKRTVSSSSSTVDIVWAAVPVGIGAASSRARCLIGSTLFRFQKFRLAGTCQGKE